MNTFTTSIILAIAIAFTTTISTVVVADTTRPSSHALRGQRQEQFPRRRHLLEDNAECVLYLKITSYEGNISKAESWSCEFSRTFAREHFGGRDKMDIQGIDKEEIDAHHAVSGETILKTGNGAVVEQSSSYALKNDQVAGSGGDDIYLVVTDPSSLVFESLTEDDERHHRYYKNRRRQLSTKKRNTGVFTTLVVRPRSPNGAIVEVSPAQLRNDIFEDKMCLKSQMAACSFNQVDIQPATIGDGGVVDVEIDVNPSNDGDGNTNEIEMTTNARVKTEEMYGGENGLKSEFDLAIFCMPPGSMNVPAFTFVNGYDSYYNNKFCTSSDILMHEVGHDFGLGHSELPPPSIWSRDFTGLMSGAGSADDPPRRCYNAMKNYILGWYDLQIDSYDPIDFVGNPQSFVLNGVADYKIDGSSNGELISLRLEQFGDEDGIDFYLGYNRKAGPNDGTPVGVDQVILYSKDRGDNYADSIRIAMLAAGQSYSIEDYKGIDSTVTITVDSISADLKDAAITISATPPPPTDAPTSSCGGVGRFKVEIGIDDFAKETNWKLFEKKSNELILIEEGMAKEEYLANQQYVEPSKSSSYCLNPGSCYLFEINDAFSDGLLPDQGGYYRGLLDEETIFVGGAFLSQDTRTFCVDAFTRPPTTPPLPTVAPTLAPTKAPTMAPAFPTIPPTTECFDDDTLRYQNVKQCKWVGLDTTKRCTLLWQNRLLKEFCPVTCGLCQPPPTPLPTKEPTAVAPTPATTKTPTTTPTPAPTPVTTSNNGDCLDNPDFRYKGVKKCKWVGTNIEERCNLDAKVGDGKFIRDYCPLTCNACEPDDDDDTDTLSCASDEILFRLELLLDKYNETSWEMKKLSDGSVIVGEGSEDKYKKNTEYVEELCLTNGDYSFTIFDIYGDGLTQGTGHYYGFLNNIEIFSGKDFKTEETATFTVTIAAAPTVAPTMAPTTAPTMAPAFPTIPPTSSSCFPFRLELLLDNYSETSWEIKKVSDGSITIGKGSEDKYKKNTEYVESLCLTNGDYSFTIFDVYGDGLTHGSGHYYGFLNNIKIFSGKEFEKEETTTFTVAVAPQLPTKEPTTEPTATPTQAPTKTPTTTPTQAPTPADTSNNGKCMDDSDFRYKGVKKCIWVAKNIEQRCNLDAKEGDGKFISDYCPVTCNACEDTGGDNGTDDDTNTSCASDEILFRLDLLLDNYDETSWEMKKVSDGSIVGEGSADKYKKKTGYNESLCLTNGEYSFTIFDVYGDGLTQGTGHYYGFLDNVEIFTGKEFEKEETTTFTVAVDDASITSANPLVPVPTPTPAPAPAPAPAPTPTHDTPSSTCIDNPTFKFKGDSSKNCDWLGENNKGKKKCKKSKQTQDDGTKLKFSDLCPKTCGVKFGVGQCN